MKDLFNEYGAVMIAVLGGGAVIGLIYQLVLSGNSGFLSALLFWCNHAC